MKGTLAIAVLGLLTTACAGHTAELRTKNEKLESELSELRAAARRERVKRQDLEKRLALSRAEKEPAGSPDGKASRESTRSERPELPVEVRSPSALGSEEELPENYEIMGIDSEGVEIVYVGEAASDEVLKIPPRSFREPEKKDRDDEPVRPSLRRAREAVSARHLEPIPTVSDRLPVTRSVPTIDSQLRQARKSVTPSRKRSLGNPRREYRRYYEALRAGNHAYAVTGFRNFVERFPAHDFADNAQYWLGEAFYDQKRYKSALSEFRKVVDQYPQGNKVPDALLKLGYCYSSLDQPAEARQVWKQILRVYPRSNPAALAKTKLSELED